MQAGDYGVAITVTAQVGPGLRNFSINGSITDVVVQLITVSPTTQTRKVFSMTPSVDGTTATYVTQPGDFPANEYGAYEWQVSVSYSGSPFIKSPWRSLPVGQAI